MSDADKSSLLELFDNISPGADHIEDHFHSSSELVVEQKKKKLVQITVNEKTICCRCRQPCNDHLNSISLVTEPTTVSATARYWFGIHSCVQPWPAGD
jgi:hypothetical protein